MRTRKYKILSAITGLLSLLLTLGPFVAYMVIAYIEAQPIQRYTLTICVVISLFLSLINILSKYHIKSTFWVLLLGLICCLDAIKNTVLLISICSVIDEFIVSPLRKNFKRKYIINKEIDRR